MFFEPTQFPDTLGLLGGLVVPLGFTSPPGGQFNSTTHVVNDHSYCCQLSPEICATGEPDIKKAVDCRDWHEKRVATRADDAKYYGVPLFISEFGACLNSTTCVQEITSLTDACDEHLAGWAYWQLKNYADLTTSAGTNSEGFYNNDGTLQDGKVKALARTYLPATQGILQTMSFNTDTADFHARFIVDTSIPEPTIVYKSDEYWYPAGFKISIYDAEGKKLTPQNSDVIIEFVPNYARILVVRESLNG
jgi:Glycoside hydrolase family 5 C-terminal domain/Cellulase (glycosyl hydrolase family 5)